MDANLYGGAYPNQNYAYYNQGFTQPNMPRISSTLSKEEMEEARKLINPQVSIKPSLLEKIRGLCNHWQANGASAVEPTKDHPVTCAVCGQVINFNQDMTPEHVQLITDEFTNMQEIAKYASYGMNEKTKRDYYGNTIPYNRKLPMIVATCQDVINRMNPANYYTQMMDSRGGMLYSSYMNSVPLGTPYMGQQPGYMGMVGGQPVMPGQPNPMGMVGGQPVMPGQPMAPPVANPFYAEAGQGQSIMNPPHGQPPMAGGVYQQPSTPPVVEGVNPLFTGGYQAPPTPTVPTPQPDVKQTNV